MLYNLASSFGLIVYVFGGFDTPSRFALLLSSYSNPLFFYLKPKIASD